MKEANETQGDLSISGDKGRTQRKGAVKFVRPEKSLFFPTLKKRVDQHFADLNRSKYGNIQLAVKTAILLAMYLLPFAALLIFTPGWAISLGLWTIMGIGMAGLGMSVMHDANHGAYSSNTALNWSMAHVLNIMGGSTINWKLQHNILHHTYTNITHMDDDIASKPALRLSPHERRRKAHRFQWWHAFLLYGLTTLYWVTAKDFVQYVKYRREKVNTASPAGNRWILSKVLIVKLAYFSVFFGLPLWLAHLPFLQVLTGFLLMHFLAGVILTVVFQLAHSLEGTSHPLPDDKGIIANDWAIHQMNTTMNFSPHNRWLSWYVGGLNFQVEHHLFPRIAHVHYPDIAPVVEATAKEFQIPYLAHAHFRDALGAHIAYLKKTGAGARLDRGDRVTDHHHFHDRLHLDHWIMQGVSQRWLIRLAVVVSLANVLIERYVRVMNTPDPEDAVYGIAGTVIAILVTLLIKQIGMRPSATPKPDQ